MIIKNNEVSEDDSDSEYQYEYDYSDDSDMQFQYKEDSDPEFSEPIEEEGYTARNTDDIIGY